MSELEVLFVEYESPDRILTERAAAILRAGGLVVAPAETRYALLGRADSDVVVNRVYEVKGRSLTTPTAVFVDSVEALSEYGEFSEIAGQLARRFLPGPLTVVLKAVCGWGPPLVVRDRIGLRVSSAAVIGAVLDSVDFPLTATSANLSGRGEVDTIPEIASALGTKIDLYLDCGQLDSAPSTVVDCTGKTARVLREGAIVTAEVEAVTKGTAG